MPATGKRIAVAGVDGCPFGWIATVRVPATGETSVAIADSFGALLDGPLSTAALIVVDMPIGLPERPGRACEHEVRRAIGPRRSSVFSSPLRGMLAFDDYQKANAYGKARGAGLSKQAWAITKKIREIDALMSPLMQTRVIEGHPELAFTRLGGAPCCYPKRTADGKRERIELLKASGVDASSMLSALRATYPRKSVFADDDFIDACALALSAEAMTADKAWRLGDGARDARGLLMEICG